MAGLVPAIHAVMKRTAAWTPRTRPGVTPRRKKALQQDAPHIFDDAGQLAHEPGRRRAVDDAMIVRQA
jgi:hypothetical protein